MKFSIITVCYNSEKTIERTIQSVLNQTFQDFEYIIVDGKSTDGTLDIVHSYEEKFAGRLKVISEKDNGIYDAMNKGIKMAQGEWIGLINSDDWYDEDALQVIYDNEEELCEQRRKKILGVIHGMCRILDDDGDVIQIIGNTAKGLKNGMIPHPSSFVHKQIYEQVGVYDQRHFSAGDYDLFLKFWENGVEFYPVEKAIANFSSGGMSFSYSGDKDALLVRKEHGLMSRQKYILARILLFCKDKVRRFL